MWPLDDLFGSKPTVPQVQPVDMGQAAIDAMRANQAALPAEEKTARQVNLFNQEQLNQMLAAAGFDMPGMGKLASAGIGRELKGELPLGDLAQQELRSVAKSFSGGYGGSGMAGDLVARDLGLTETELFGKGLSSAESWMSAVDRIYAPGMMNLAAMQFTPQQGLAHATEERNTQFERQWLQNQISAMPDPGAAGALNTTMSLIASVRGGSQPGNLTNTNYPTMSPGGGSPTYPASQTTYDTGASYPATGPESMFYGGGGGGAGTNFNINVTGDQSFDTFNMQDLSTQGMGWGMTSPTG